MSMVENWRNYEDAARKIIGKLNSMKDELRIEKITDKQKIKGKSGEEWEMEIMASDSESGKPILLECKCWAKPIPRDVIVSLAYKIKDVGGERGFIITTIGLQKGAKKIAELENIEIIKLNYDATADRFDLVLPNRGQHHLGVHAVGKFKDEVKMVRIPRIKKKISE
jgi:hypothetical protein